MGGVGGGWEKNREIQRKPVRHVVICLLLPFVSTELQHYTVMSNNSLTLFPVCESMFALLRSSAQNA